MLMLQRPEITQEELGKNRTQFVIEPLEPGFGLTLGNTMRRALLSRVPGVAVTGIKIDGVNHEFTSIPGVVEDVLDLLLNLKRLVLKVDDQENHKNGTSGNNGEEQCEKDHCRFGCICESINGSTKNIAPSHCGKEECMFR